jgi:hypothetical protein
MVVFVSRTSLVIAYVRTSILEIYVFRGNPFQAHSLQHSYHPTQPVEREKYVIQNKNISVKIIAKILLMLKV